MNINYAFRQKLIPLDGLDFNLNYGREYFPREVQWQVDILYWGLCMYSLKNKALCFLVSLKGEERVCNGDCTM